MKKSAHTYVVVKLQSHWQRRILKSNERIVLVEVKGRKLFCQKDVTKEMDLTGAWKED